MRKKTTTGTLLLTIGFLCTLSCAGLLFSTGHPLPNGLEPKPWSKDLERLLAKTHHREEYLQYDDIRETVFDIQFNERENFEKLWPSILSLKSKGAPLILRTGPSTHRRFDPIMNGVHVLYPLRDQEGLSNPGIDPKLLELLLSSPGVPPEYVEIDGNNVTPFSDVLPKPLARHEKLREAIYRVRTDIILVIDGNVVDLNRIPLPEDTPIIDQRFAEHGAASHAAAQRP